jgi:hypothetical protein
MTYAVALIATVIAAAALTSIVAGLYLSFWHLRRFRRLRSISKKHDRKLDVLQRSEIAKQQSPGNRDD